MKSTYSTLFALALCAVAGADAAVSGSLSPYITENNGKLSYGRVNLSNDLIIDFSHAGYKGGVALPSIDSIPVKRIVTATGVNDTTRIQAAINYVSNLPIQANGYRGAVLMQAGTYDIRKPVRITKSGVVLRGEGIGKTIWTSDALSEQRDGSNVFLEVDGGGSTVPKRELMGKTSGNNPAGLRKVVYEHTNSSIPAPKVGDWIDVKMLLNKKGQEDLKMANPSNRNLNRGQVRMKVTGVKKKSGKIYELKTDIPLVFGLRPAYGGGEVRKLSRRSSVPKNIGIRDFMMQPKFNKSSNGLLVRKCKSIGITLNNVEDVWVDNMVLLNMYENGIKPLDECFQSTIKRVHVQSMPLASNEIRDGGYFTGGSFGFRGERMLLTAVTADVVRHGPLGNQPAAYNAIVDLLRPNNGCEPGHLNMVPASLFDRAGRAIPEGGINPMNAGSPGHGWLAQNALLWNCVVDKIKCESPRKGKERVQFGENYPSFPRNASEDPIFRNLAIGCFRRINEPRYDARDFISFKNLAVPDSIYVRQLQDRIGASAANRRLPAWQVKGYGPAPAMAANGNKLTLSLAPIAREAYKLNSNSNFTIFWTDQVNQPYGSWKRYSGPITMNNNKTYYARVVCNTGPAKGKESPISYYSPKYKYETVYFKSYFQDIAKVNQNIKNVLAGD